MTVSPPEMSPACVILLKPLLQPAAQEIQEVVGTTVHSVPVELNSLA